MPGTAVIRIAAVPPFPPLNQTSMTKLARPPCRTLVKPCRERTDRHKCAEADGVVDAVPGLGLVGAGLVGAGSEVGLAGVGAVVRGALVLGAGVGVVVVGVGVGAVVLGVGVGVVAVGVGVGAVVLGVGVGVVEVGAGELDVGVAVGMAVGVETVLLAGVTVGRIPPYAAGLLVDGAASGLGLMVTGLELVAWDSPWRKR